MTKIITKINITITITVILICFISFSSNCTASNINNDNLEYQEYKEYKEYDIILGNKDANLTIIEYFSPTCGSCLYFKQNLFPKLKQQYIDSGKIKYIMRPLIDNKPALDATLLAYSSGKENFYFIMNELMQNQNQWLNFEEYFINYARKIGKEKIYMEYLQDENFKRGLLMISYDLFREGQIAGVPSFIINGKLFEGEYDLKSFQYAIDVELLKI